jgi:hypothetical protein
LVISISTHEVEMPLVQAWQCPKTGKLFAQKSEYHAHLRRKAKVALRERNERRLIEEFELRAEAGRISCFAIKDVETWLEANIPLIYTQCRRTWTKSKGPPEITQIRFSNMRFGIQSNSHRAPLGKKTNWCGNESKNGVPRGYPGWIGSISYNNSDYMNWDTDAWSSVGVSTGSGGGGDRARYDVTLWHDDFPNLLFGALMRHEIAKKTADRVFLEHEDMLREAEAIAASASAEKPRHR